MYETEAEALEEAKRQVRATGLGTYVWSVRPCGVGPFITRPDYHPGQFYQANVRADGSVWHVAGRDR